MRWHGSPPPGRSKVLDRTMPHPAPVLGATVSFTIHPTAPTRAELREAARLGPDGWVVEFLGYGGAVLSHPKGTRDGHGLWVYLSQLQGPPGGSSAPGGSHPQR
jgi:hypothetical protein